MKKVIKCISMLLILCIFSGTMATAAYAATDNIVPVHVNAFSDIIGETELNLYVHGNVVMLEASEIADLTRSTLTVKGSTATFSYGVFDIDVDCKKGSVKFDELNYKNGLATARYAGALLIDISLLPAMGADIRVESLDGENAFLVVNMPAITVWEALADFNMLPYDASDEMSKTQLYAVMTADIVNEILFGHGFSTKSEDIEKDIFLDILNYPFAEDNTVAECIDEYSLMDNLDVPKEILGFINDSGYVESAADGYYAGVQELLSWKHDNVVSARIAYSNGESIEQYADKARSLYTSAKAQEQIVYRLDSLSAAMTTVEFAWKIIGIIDQAGQTCDSIFNINASSLDLMKDVYGSQMRTRHNLKSSNSGWYSTADDVIRLAESSSSQVIIEEYLNTTLDTIQNELFDESIKLFSGGNPAAAYLKLAKPIVSIFNYKSIEASKADLRRLYMSDMFEYLSYIFKKESKAMTQSSGKDVDSLVNLVECCRYNCLATLVFTDYTTVEANGNTMSKKKRAAVLDAAAEMKKRYTKSYYELSSCEIVPFEVSMSDYYSLLSDLGCADQLIVTEPNDDIVSDDNTSEDNVTVEFSAGDYAPQAIFMRAYDRSNSTDYYLCFKPADGSIITYDPKGDTGDKPLPYSTEAWNYEFYKSAYNGNNTYSISYGDTEYIVTDCMESEYVNSGEARVFYEDDDLLLWGLLYGKVTDDILRYDAYMIDKGTNTSSYMFSYNTDGVVPICEANLFLSSDFIYYKGNGCLYARSIDPASFGKIVLTINLDGIVKHYLNSDSDISVRLKGIRY